MSEILLYNQINEWSASEFITAMNAVGIDEEICVRINGVGGDPTFGFGMIAKFKEHKGVKIIKVDGQAHSMYAFMLCYVDNSEALEVAEMVIHRAAYPAWFESNPEYFTESTKQNVININTFLRKAFEAKVDVEKFEAMKGVKIKDIFSLDGRIETTLTASEAKKIGLINRVVAITPSKSAEIKQLKVQLAAKYSGIESNPEITNPITKKTDAMNLSELKTNHPAVFAEAVALGASQEKSRVESCLVFMDIDAAGVKAAIESGAELSAKQMAEFSLKAASKMQLGAIADDSTKEISTKEIEAEATAKEKTMTDFTALVKKELQMK